MDRDEKLQALKNYLEARIEALVEYNECHDDAGTGYYHMIQESGITLKDIRDLFERSSGTYSRNKARELLSRMTEDDFSDLIRDYILEMRPGHIFSGYPSDAILLDSYPVGEIEDQLNYEDIASEMEAIGIETKAEWIELMKETDCRCSFCGPNREPQFYNYSSSDGIWQQVVSEDGLEEWLNERAKYLAAPK